MPKPNKGPRLEPNDFGIYEIRWSEKGRSKRASTRTGDLQEAQKVFAGWILEAERARAGHWSANEALDYYEAEHLDVGATSCPENDRWRMKNLRPYFGDMLVGEIEAKDVNDYCRRRRAGKVGWIDDEGERHGYRKAVDSTIRRELAVLVAAFNFCADQKKIDRAHIPTIPLPAEGEARDHWLTEEELDLLMEAAQPKGEKRLTRAYRFIALARYTAARKTVIQKMDWFRVSLDRGQVDYRTPGERVTKKRKVPVPIADDLMPILQRAHREKISEHVLDHPGSIRKAFDTAVERAARTAEKRGKPAMAARLRLTTPHTLRHTWATLAAQRGVPLWSIAGVLGDTLATVEKNYAHHCPDHLRGAVNSGRQTGHYPGVTPDLGVSVDQQ